MIMTMWAGSPPCSLRTLLSRHVSRTLPAHHGLRRALSRKRRMCATLHANYGWPRDGGDEGESAWCHRHAHARPLLPDERRRGAIVPSLEVPCYSIATANVAKRGHVQQQQ